MIDPDRRPTAFQWRVLHIVRVYGPISIAGIQEHMQQQGNAAIRSACHILYCGGYLNRAGGQVDVTAAGRHVLALHRDSKPRPPLFARLLQLLRRRLPLYAQIDSQQLDGT